MVADKVNFFADVFEFTVSGLGHPGFVNLENHNSLLEKIKFQLDNYTPHSTHYIKHYFSNKLLSNKDQFVKGYCPAEMKSINALKEDFYNNPGDVKVRARLNDEISQLLGQLDESLFVNSLNEVITTIVCPQPLGKHNHVGVIEYFTPLIVTEFLFAGFPKENLHNVFDKILAKEVTIENGKVRTDAPLPESLLAYRSMPDKFFDEANRYLNHRSLRQQFEGLFFLFRHSAKYKTYVFRLGAVSAFSPVTIEHNGVVISNQLRKKYVRRGKTQKGFRTFFRGKGTLYVEVSIKINDDKVGKAQAEKKILSTLSYFNAVLHKRACLEGDEYVAKDDDGTFRHSSHPKVLRVDEIPEFTDNNLRLVFDGSNRLHQKFIALEDIYFEAFNSTLKDYRLCTTGVISKRCSTKTQTLNR